jgi:hypothetical protein
MNGAGDQFLAGPRLAANQDVDVRVGNPRDRLKHRLHGRAAADEVLEPVGSLDLAPQQVVGSLLTVLFQKARRRRPQLAGQVIQRHEVARATAKALGHTVHRRRAGNHDDRQGGIDGAHLLKQFKAVDSRRIQRNQQQVERPARQLFQCGVGRAHDQRLAEANGLARRAIHDLGSRFAVNHKSLGAFHRGANRYRRVGQ